MLVLVESDACPSGRPSHTGTWASPTRIPGAAALWRGSPCTPAASQVLTAPGIWWTQEPRWLSELGVLGAPQVQGVKVWGVPEVRSNPSVLRETLQDLSSLPTVGGGAVGAVCGQTVSQPLLPASR